MRKKKKIRGNYLEYKDTEVVFAEGSGGKAVYFILSGRAEVSQIIAGKKETIAVLKEGDFFGEMAALNGDVRSMTVAAIGDLRLSELSLDEMLKYMQSEPEILKNMCASLSRRLRDTNLKVRELTRKVVAIVENEEDWMADSLDKIHVLVVDDEESIVEALEALLSEEYNVFTALDGVCALHIMGLHDIALVLTDERMPSMSGTELLENIKRMYPDVIRIMISSYFDQEILMKAIREIQIHDVISKPWRSGEVTFTVARWVAQYKKVKRMEEKANRYTVIQKELEKANEVIQQLIQELREAK